VGISQPGLRNCASRRITGWPRTLQSPREIVDVPRRASRGRARGSSHLAVALRHGASRDTGPGTGRSTVSVPVRSRPPRSSVPQTVCCTDRPAHGRPCCGCAGT